MRNHQASIFLRWAAALAISLLFLVSAFGQEAGTRPVPLTAEERDSLSANLEIAFSQHEIILLYIKTDQFEKVAPAAHVLLSLKLPADQEFNTVRSLIIITKELYKKGQSGLAHQVLAAAAKNLTANSNKSKVYLLQALAYTRDGLDDKAIECYLKSQELITKSPE
jgi:tetratricopeptide (TPR) repeat protein